MGFGEQDCLGWTRSNFSLWHLKGRQEKPGVLDLETRPLIWKQMQLTEVRAGLSFTVTSLERLPADWTPSPPKGRTSITHIAFLNSGNKPLQSRHTAAPRPRAAHRSQYSGDLSHSRARPYNPQLARLQSKFIFWLRVWGFWEADQTVQAPLLNGDVGTVPNITHGLGWWRLVKKKEEEKERSDWHSELWMQKSSSNFQSFTVCTDTDGTLQRQQGFTHSARHSCRSWLRI